MSDPTTKPDPAVSPVVEEQTSAISGRNWIHYDPDRVDYAINDQEISELEAAAGNIWKDICLVSFGIGLPSIVNAITIAQAVRPKNEGNFVPDLPFTINLVFGVVGFALTLAFGIAWRKTAKKVTSITDKIRKKPKISLN